MYLKFINDVITYPYTIANLIAENPNTSFVSDIENYPSRLAEWGVFPVIETNKPSYSKYTEFVDEITPVFDNGQWVQTWSIRAITLVELNDVINQLKSEVIVSTQNRLDSFAQSRGYDGILSLCTYATSSVVKFQAEGAYGVQARDDTWATLNQILYDAENQLRPIPMDYSEIEPELPILTWPN